LIFSDHVVGDGLRFQELVCRMKLEGVISKRLDWTYAPDNRGLWVKSKRLNSTWTADGLIRQSSYQGQRHDKPAKDVLRPAPRKIIK